MKKRATTHLLAISSVVTLAATWVLCSISYSAQAAIIQATCQHILPCHSFPLDCWIESWTLFQASPHLLVNLNVFFPGFYGWRRLSCTQAAQSNDEVLYL